jgi:hypothetical protein
MWILEQVNKIILLPLTASKCVSTSLYTFSEGADDDALQELLVLQSPHSFIYFLLCLDMVFIYIVGFMHQSATQISLHSRHAPQMIKNFTVTVVNAAIAIYVLEMWLLGTLLLAMVRTMVMIGETDSSILMLMSTTTTFSQDLVKMRSASILIVPVRFPPQELTYMMATCWVTHWQNWPDISATWGQVACPTDMPISCLGKYY